MAGMQRSILDNFSKLSNANEKVRIKAGVFLLKHVVENSEPKNITNEQKYTLTRLIRGTGSSNVSSRIGYYSTLVTFLKASPIITTEQIFNVIKNELQTGSSNSKSEKGDIYAGQILVCGAIIRSGLYAKSTVEEQKSIVERIVAAAKKRSYLLVASSVFIADLFENDVDEKLFKTAVWPVLKPEIVKPFQEQSLDTLYLFSIIHTKFPNVLSKAILKKTIGSEEIITDENAAPICHVLMNVSNALYLKHPIYSLMCKRFAMSDTALSFVQQVDFQLSKPTHNKFLAATIILTNVLTHLTDASIINDVVTNNYVTQVLEYFRFSQSLYQDNFKKQIADLFDKVFVIVKRDDTKTKVKISLVKKLLFDPGTVTFEKITKSRLIQQITGTLNTEGIKKIAKLYQKVLLLDKTKILSEDSKEFWTNSDRIYAAQLLVKLMANPNMQSEVEWKMEKLKLLMNVSLIKSEEYGNVGFELSAALHMTFFRSLDLKFSKLEDMRKVLSTLLHELDTVVTSENLQTHLRNPLSEEDIELWKKTVAIITKLEDPAKTKEKRKHTNAVFHTLFLHMGLQLFNERDLAVSSLNELFSCYKKVKSKKHRKSNDLGEENVETNEPMWIEVVVDLFLNLLSHNSHLLRNIINCVFPHLCKYMTASSLHQILSVLDPKNEDSPLSKLYETDSDDSDSENVNGETVSESEESDSEEEDQENEEHEKVNDKLRMAVRAALGGYQTDEESVDVDQMSDSEGQRLDEALVQAFRQFKPNLGRANKKQTKDDKTLTHFRTRVLDLIEIYLDSEPPMLSCLEIMLPLLQTFEFCIRDVHQLPLQERVGRCLKKLSTLKKFENVEGVNETVLCDLLNSLLDKATKSAIIVQEMADKITECCTFLINCSLTVNSSEDTPKKIKKRLRKGIVNILQETLNTFMATRGSLVPFVLFKSSLQLNWEGNFTFIPVLFNFIFNEELRPFRISQGLELLKIFYTNRRPFQTYPEVYESKLKEQEQTFLENITAYFEKLTSDPSKMDVKQRFIYHLLNLIAAMKSNPVTSENGTEIWEKLGENIREFRSHVTFAQDAKKAYQKVCSTLHISSVVKMKNQIKLGKVNGTEASNESGSVNKQKPKPQKTTNSKKKLKKQARILRMQSMSEGLSSSLDFSGVKISSMNRNEDPEVTGNKKVKTKEDGGNSPVVNGIMQNSADSSLLKIDQVNVQQKKHNIKLKNSNSENTNSLEVSTLMSKNNKKPNKRSLGGNILLPNKSHLNSSIKKAKIV